MGPRDNVDVKYRVPSRSVLFFGKFNNACSLCSLYSTE
jgi:hypothetical protein